MINCQSSTMLEYIDWVEFLIKISPSIDKMVWCQSDCGVQGCCNRHVHSSQSGLFFKKCLHFTVHDFSFEWNCVIQNHEWLNN